MEILTDNMEEKDLILAQINRQLQKLKERKSDLRRKFKSLEKTDTKDFYIINEVVKNLYNLGEINEKQAVKLDFYAGLSHKDAEIVLDILNERYQKNLSNFYGIAKDLFKFVNYVNFHRICAKSCFDTSVRLTKGYDFIWGSDTEYFDKKASFENQRYKMLCKSKDYLENIEQVIDMRELDFVGDRFIMRMLSKRIMADAVAIHNISMVNGEEDGLIVARTANILRTAMSQDGYKALRNLDKNVSKTQKEVDNFIEQM